METEQGNKAVFLHIHVKNNVFKTSEVICDFLSKLGSSLKFENVLDDPLNKACPAHHSSSSSMSAIPSDVVVRYPEGAFVFNSYHTNSFFGNIVFTSFNLFHTDLTITL